MLSASDESGGLLRRFATKRFVTKRCRVREAEQLMVDRSGIGGLIHW